MIDNTAFVPVIHRDHVVLAQAHAELPLWGSDKPEHQTIMDKHGSPIRSVKIVPDTVWFGNTLPAEDMYAISCAVLDWTNKVVYARTGYTHTGIMNAVHESGSEVCDVTTDTSQQRWTDKGLISGFVTASGHFFNRAATHYVMRRYHPDLLTEKALPMAYFGPEMINWHAVYTKHKTLTLSSWRDGYRLNNCHTQSPYE